jgi:hypothetical protein
MERQHAVAKNAGVPLYAPLGLLPQSLHWTLDADCSRPYVVVCEPTHSQDAYPLDRVRTVGGIEALTSLTTTTRFTQMAGVRK